MTVATDSAAPQRRGQLDSLTGLRAIAAFLVFAGHAALNQHTEWALIQSSAAVSFFVVLSGFVLVWVGDDRLRSGAFYRRRFARLYPAYAVTWLLGIVFSVAVGLHERVAVALTGAALLQSWVPHSEWYYGFNSVAWSLSCEAFFYASFPLWAPVLARTTRRRRLAVAALAVAVVFALGIVGELRSPYASVTAWPDDSRIEWLIRVAPPVRIAEFLLGAILAMEMRRGWRFPLPLPLVLAATIVTYLAIPQADARWQAVALPLLPFVALVGAAAQADLDKRRTWLRHPWLVWGGTISYSFYLVHQLVVRTMHEFVSQQWVLVPLSLLVSTALAAALHRWVEMPANRRLRGETPTPASPARGRATSGAAG